MIEQIKLHQILNLILDVDNPFTFSRWGDGEWRSVLQRNTHGNRNCDGHRFYPEMGIQLRKVLQAKPTYMLGMQRFAMKQYGSAILKYLEGNQLNQLRWVDADVFHYGAIKGKMERILDVVRGRKLLVVGPPHLKQLRKKGLPYWKYVEVPPRNAFLSLDDIYRHTVAVAEDQRDPLLISVSASMPAEILCDQLFDRLGHRDTIIDFGSLWDPLVGVQSRSYMRKTG